MSVQDDTITAQVMNNIDQLYTAHGQGIQPLYNEASGKTPAFTYNNVISAINNGYLPVCVYYDESVTAQNYSNVVQFGIESSEYVVYTNYGAFSASNPDSYLSTAK